MLQELTNRVGRRCPALALVDARIGASTIVSDAWPGADQSSTGSPCTQNGGGGSTGAARIRSRVRSMTFSAIIRLQWLFPEYLIKKTTLQP